MIEFIDKEEALRAMGAAFGDMAEAADNVRNVPAADVKTVVRCKDCRHRDPEDHKCDSGQLERAGCIFPVDDEYFCAYGER